ncbi:MAG TPA: hypothetical protein DIT25_02715 [Candidatus Moranbacteria bacterium]|nr:hypothetical protein [Candidatus Moranbacteria bacterium]
MLKKIFQFLLQPLFKERKSREALHGVAKIISVPPTTVQGNSLELRKLWIGCEIPGELISLDLFSASFDDCMQSLRKKHGPAAEDYIKFWEKWWQDNEPYIHLGETKMLVTTTLDFQNCFVFVTNKNPN